MEADTQVIPLWITPLTLANATVCRKWFSSATLRHSDCATLVIGNGGDNHAALQLSLTRALWSRNFNRLPRTDGACDFPVCSSCRPRRRSRERHDEAYFPAQQPPPRQEARLPPAYAYPRRPRHPLGSSPQGTQRAFGLTIVLAAANRLTRADEFRQTIRRGQKVSVEGCLLSVFPTAQDHPVRFGFIVGKTVGNAVTRNRVRRRMRAAAFQLVRSGIRGVDVVVRGLPGSVFVSVDSFVAEFRRAVQR